MPEVKKEIKNTRHPTKGKASSDCTAAELL